MEQSHIVNVWQRPEYELFLQAIQKDEAAWLILADWLETDGNAPAYAEHIRRGRPCLVVPDYGSPRKYATTDLGSDSWRDPFGYSEVDSANPGLPRWPITPQDVAWVLAAVEGENDTRLWALAGRLWDGRYFFLVASCCYTGFHAGGGAEIAVAATLPELLQVEMFASERGYLGLEPIPVHLLS